MYTLLSDDQHRFKKKTSENPRQNPIEDKSSVRQNPVRDNFFSNKQILFWILSGTEFCLGLHTAVVFHMQSFNSSM